MARKKRASKFDSVRLHLVAKTDKTSFQVKQINPLNSIGAQQTGNLFIFEHAFFELWETSEWTSADWAHNEQCTLDLKSRDQRLEKRQNSQVEYTEYLIVVDEVVHLQYVEFEGSLT